MNNEAEEAYNKKLDMLNKSLQKLGLGGIFTETLDGLLDATLEPALKGLKRVERIYPNDPYFIRAKSLCQKYKLPPQGFENFQRLLCGIRNFPCILLINPKNDDYEFEEMVSKTTTLRWLEEALNNIGFELDDIITMDLFPMLTDEWVDNHPHESRQAVQDMFGLTLDFINEFKPNVILSCQCLNPSKKVRWKSFKHDMADKLRSSMEGAEIQKVSEFPYKGHLTHVVHGFHPASMEYVRERNPEKSEKLDTTLRTTFNSLFKPYADWMESYKTELLASHNTNIVMIRTVIKLLRLRVTDCDRIRGQEFALGMSQGHDDLNLLDEWNDVKNALDTILNKTSPNTSERLLS